MIRLITFLYSSLLELLIILSFLLGIYMAVNLIPDAILPESFYENRVAWKTFIGILIALVFQVIFFAPLLVLIEIMDLVDKIRCAVESKKTDASQKS